MFSSSVNEAIYCTYDSVYSICAKNLTWCSSIITVAEFLAAFITELHAIEVKTRPKIIFLPELLAIDLKTYSVIHCHAQVKKFK